MIPKFYFVLRFDKDGNELGTVDIPERDLHQTLLQHPTWKVVGETSSLVPPKIERLEPTKTTVECPLCGAEFVNEQGLKIHKARAHK